MRERQLGLILVGVSVICFAAHAQATRTTSKSTLSPVYVVRKPTLISSIVVTQAEVNSSDEANEALSDYQYYLGHAIAVLKPHGVQVYLTNDSTVRWRDSLGVHSISAADSGGVLYLFVAPSGQIRMLRSGVEVDEAIIDVARQLFGSSIPDFKDESDKP